MKNKKIIFIPTVVIIAASITYGSFNILSSDSGYLQPQEKIASATKVVGTDNLGFSKAEASVPQLAKDWDLIVVGKITSDVIGKKSYDIIPESSELDNKFKSLYPNAEKPKDTALYYNVAVDKVLAGSIDKSKIVFSQLAAQTKLKKGQKVIMMLIKDTSADNDDTYCSVALEDGIFLLNDDDSLTSLSNNKYTSAYDGYKADRIIKDISKALKDNSIKPMFEKVKINK